MHSLHPRGRGQIILETEQPPDLVAAAFPFDGHRRAGRVGGLLDLLRKGIIGFHVTSQIFRSLLRPLLGRTDQPGKTIVH